MISVLTLLFACSGAAAPDAAPEPAPAPAEPATPTEEPAADPSAYPTLPSPPETPVEDPGGWCAHYYALLTAESHRGADDAAAHEAARLEAMSALKEAMGNHPAGVAWGLTELANAPLGGEATISMEMIHEHWSGINGYVGPVCGI